MSCEFGRSRPRTHCSGWIQAFAAILIISPITLHAALAAESFRQLKGKEIRPKISGMDFTDDIHWAIAFGRDGRVTSYDMGKKTSGTWRVEKEELCIAVKGEERHCYSVWMSGTAVQLRESDGTLTMEGILQKSSKGGRSRPKGNDC